MPNNIHIFRIKSHLIYIIVHAHKYNSHHNPKLSFLKHAKYGQVPNMDKCQIWTSPKYGRAIYTDVPNMDTC